MRQDFWGAATSPTRHLLTCTVRTLRSSLTPASFPMWRVCILTQEGKWKVHREEDELRQSLCHMIVTYKVSNKGTSSVWWRFTVECELLQYLRRKDPDTQEARSPTNPSFSPSPPLHAVGQLRQRAPCFPKAEAEGSPDGIPGCLQHTFSLLPVMYKAESWSMLHTPNPHRDHSSTCTSDRRPQEKCTRNQIMAIDRQSESPQAQKPAGAGRATAAGPGSAALSPADLGGHICRPNARPRSQPQD